MKAKINVLAELERYGVQFTWAGEQELRVLCPFHDDTTPSCFINIEKQIFKCHTAGCEEHGDIITLLAKILRTTRAAVYADLGTRYSLDSSKIIDPQVIERYHKRISSARVLKKALYDRGVTDEMIRKYRLGEYNGRITIPVRNTQGLFVNIRKYLPGAPGSEKMRNHKGFGRVRLFPIEQLKYEDVLITGGEIKAIVAADELNKVQVGAITVTAGEGNWEPEFSKQFAHKNVYVCFDIDEPGRRAAEKVAKLLYKFAAGVYIIDLPLDINEFPKGDINDYVAQGHTIYPLLQDARSWVPQSEANMEYTEPTECALAESVKAKYTHSRIKVRAIVSAMDETPYLIPKDFVVECTRDAKECALCAVYNGEEKYEVDPESDVILEMVGTHKVVQADALKKYAGVPLTCRKCECVPSTFYNIEDARLSPQLEITNSSTDRIMQPALCIGYGLELNETYEFIGRMHPHPRTQQSILLISDYTPTKDALSVYQTSYSDELTIFRPTEWRLDALSHKLMTIYSDFSANVTRIFQRPNLHLAIDLAYHSPLLLRFDGQIVKGWSEILILGDSAQGKSETAISLMNHYQVGEKVECKNASVAGLLGGLQQMGTKWFVTWGMIPTHDRRLVILEELKGANTEVISKLTDMRSSGIAEIPKIEKRRTHARTRLIALSNPRSDRPLASYNYGLEAVKELVGNLEDIRRFDFVFMVSAKEIDPKTLNKLQALRPKIEHQFTSDLCHKLIIWAWTRSADDIKINDLTANRILQRASELTERYTDAIPIVDKGSIRLKIARLSAALAARTYSTSDGHDVIVRECHVNYIFKLLNKTYSSNIFGYLDFSRGHELTNTLLHPEKIARCINSTAYPKDFAEQLLHLNKFDMVDIQDLCACERPEAQKILSLFVRKRAVTRVGRSYRKNPPFIELLKLLLINGELSDRPAFIDEGDF